jgi:hypothetical protein
LHRQGLRHMAMMGCSGFLDRLDAWIEGERPSDARAHVRECPACRSLAEDMETIRTAAQSMANIEVEPPARIWTSLAAQLAREGLIHDGRHSAAKRLRGWLDAVFAPLPRPALAGAYLTALVALGFALSGPVHTRLNEHSWIASTQLSTVSLSAQLDSAEEETVASLRNYNPALRASLDQNLAIVNNYIVLCEKSVREEPENETARDYLYEAYQQKADLLAEMAERGDNIR